MKFSIIFLTIMFALLSISLSAHMVHDTTSSTQSLHNSRKISDLKARGLLGWGGSSIYKNHEFPNARGPGVLQVKIKNGYGYLNENAVVDESVTYGEKSFSAGSVISKGTKIGKAFVSDMGPEMAETISWSEVTDAGLALLLL